MDKQNIIIGLLVFIALLVIFIAVGLDTVNKSFYKKTHHKLRRLAFLMFRLHKDSNNTINKKNPISSSDEKDIDTILKGYSLDKDGWKN